MVTGTSSGLSGREKMISDLTERKAYLDQLRRGVWAIFGLLFVAAIAAPGYLFYSNNYVLGTIWLLGGCASVLFLYVIQQGRNSEISDISFEIELAGYDISEHQIRAERLFRRNETELLKYYTLNLKQNTTVLLLGIFCIVISLFISIFTIVLIAFPHKFGIPAPTSEGWTQGIIAGVGAIGTIMTNVVGVIYLQIHAKAAEALGQFHERLVRTNQIFLGNVLASRLSDSTELLKEMVRAIVAK